MKPQFFILFLIIFMSVEPILADLAVDQGPSWSSYLNDMQRSYGPEEPIGKIISWLASGDDSYRLGNYNEALELFKNALTISRSYSGGNPPLKHWS